MKSFLLIFGVLFVCSTSHARIVHYNCASYEDKEQANVTLESSSLEVTGLFRGQNISGLSTKKVSPNIHLPFVNAAGEELELYLDVKAKILSVRDNVGVIYQGYCF